MPEVESSRTHFEVLGLEGQVLENWPVLGSRTAIFFELKFCGALEKFFGIRFFVVIAWKIFVKTFFFWRLPEKILWRPFLFLESTCACVLGLESVCPRKGCPWPWVLNSTSDKCTNASVARKKIKDIKSHSVSASGCQKKWLRMGFEPMPAETYSTGFEVAAVLQCTI